MDPDIRRGRFITPLVDLSDFGEIYDVRDYVGDLLEVVDERPFSK